MRATTFLPLIILQTAGNPVNETVTLNQALSIIQDTTMMRPFEFDTAYGNKCTNGFNKTYLTERYEDSLNDSHVYSEFCVTSETSKIIVFDRNQNMTYGLRATCPKFQHNHIIIEYVKTFKNCQIDTMQTMLVTFQNDIAELYDDHNELLAIYIALLCMCLRIISTKCQSTLRPELTNRVLNMVLARLTGIEPNNSDAPYEGKQLVIKINEDAQRIQNKLFNTALATLVWITFLTLIPIRTIATRGNSIPRNCCGIIAKLCEIFRFMLIQIVNFPLDNPTVMNWHKLWTYIRESWWQTSRTPSQMAIQMCRSRIFESPCLSCSPLNTNEIAIARTQDTQDNIMASAEVKERIGIVVKPDEMEQVAKWPKSCSRSFMKLIVRMITITFSIFITFIIISKINNISLGEAAETMILLIRNRRPDFTNWLDNFNT